MPADHVDLRDAHHDQIAALKQQVTAVTIQRDNVMQVMEQERAAMRSERQQHQQAIETYDAEIAALREELAEAKAVNASLRSGATA